MNQLPPVRSDFHETFQGRSTDNIFKFTQAIFDIYCTNEDMADFLNLQGEAGFHALDKLRPDLNKHLQDP